MKIDFPGLGVATATLYPDSQHPSGWINRHWLCETLKSSLEKIAECNRITLHFEEEATFSLYGVTYKRLYVELQQANGNIWARFCSQQRGDNWARGTMTDKAREYLDKRYGEALRRAYPVILPQLREKYRAQYLESVRAEMGAYEERFRELREFMGDSQPVQFIPVPKPKKVGKRPKNDNLAFLPADSWYRREHGHRMAALGRMSMDYVRDLEYKYKCWLESEDKLAYQDQKIVFG